MFSKEQVEQLESGLGRSVVRERKQGGRMVAYVEGWRMIEEANRIFGFGGWSRETVMMNCVTERERGIGREQKPGFGVSYIARVRIIVMADGDFITREGTGAGHGIDVDVG